VCKRSMFGKNKMHEKVVKKRRRSIKKVEIRNSRQLGSRMKILYENRKPIEKWSFIGVMQVNIMRRMDEVRWRMYWHCCDMMDHSTALS
jgi:hypothetical protein